MRLIGQANRLWNTFGTVLNYCHTLGFFVQKMCMPTSIYGSVATTTLRCGQDGTEKDEDRPDHLFEHVRSETPSSVYINNMT